MNEANLLEADEVFITSSIRELVPVVKVDERAVGNGRVGPVFRRLRAEFDAYVERSIAQAAG